MLPEAHSLPEPQPPRQAPGLGDDPHVSAEQGSCAGAQQGPAPPGESSGSAQTWKDKCSKVLTTAGLPDDVYDEVVTRLDFDFAVDLLTGAAQLAPGVEELIEKRIIDMPVWPFWVQVENLNPKPQTLRASSM